MTIKQIPETERPYEKLELYGEKFLSNAELLAIIIKTGTKEETSVQIAQKILQMNDTEMDDLKFLQTLTMEELKQIKGIGKIKAIQIKAACEIANRLLTPTNYSKITIKEPKDIANILFGTMRFEKAEIAKIIILNNKNKILKIKNIALGGTNFANIQLQSILYEPIKMNSTKIILAHNHPSGDSKPSKNDIIFTERLLEATQLVGIQLLDHIVIGDGKYTSILSMLS